MLSQKVRSMSRNPVGGVELGKDWVSGLPARTVAIALSIFGSATVAHGSASLASTGTSNTGTAPDLAQRVSIPRLNRSILRVGSQGEEVTELQGVLKLLGYYSGSVNGAYDNPTADAVRRFQQAARLNPDGIVGMDTWDRLLPSVPTQTGDLPDRPSACIPQAVAGVTGSGDLPFLQFGMRGTAVVALQRRLQTQGYFSGIIDGIFGSETEEAVRAAQQTYNLTANGLVDSRFWEVLLR